MVRANIRIGNANFLRNKDAVENRFKSEVVMDSQQQIEGVVHRMVDWTVQRNLRLWSGVFAELDAHTERLRASGALAPHGDTEFQYNREELFARLREPVERRLNEFDTEDEARGIVDSVKAGGGADVRRERARGGARRVIHRRVHDCGARCNRRADCDDIRHRRMAHHSRTASPAHPRVRNEDREARTRISLRCFAAKFEEQLSRYEQQLLEVIPPYERFLETEREKLDRARTELESASREVDALEQQIATTFSTPAQDTQKSEQDRWPDPDIVLILGGYPPNAARLRIALRRRG